MSSDANRRSHSLRPEQGALRRSGWIVGNPEVIGDTNSHAHSISPWPVIRPKFADIRDQAVEPRVI
jgi:hypothetical protein